MNNVKLTLKYTQKIYILFLLIFVAGCSNSNSSKIETSEALKTLPFPVTVAEMSQETVLDIIDKDLYKYQLIDVRTPEEYKSGHIKTAINIPHSEILADPSLLAPYADKHVVLYCRSGARVGSVILMLETSLIQNVSHLTGDMLEWNRNKLPVVILK